MQRRIYYHDTDCGGVVYYANYLKFFEEARTEFFEQRGVFMTELSRAGTLFVVYRQEVTYKLSAVYGDLLEVATVIYAIQAAKIDFGHTVKNQQGKLICEARTIMVCVDGHLKPKPVPQDLSQALLAARGREIGKEA